MTRRWRFSQVVKDAETRIEERFSAPWRPVYLENAPYTVADHLRETDQKIRQSLKMVTPTVLDVMAALLLISHAREQFTLTTDSAELDLIDAARQAGMGWNEIGDALGYTAASAGVSAKHRYRTLLAKFPSRTPRTFTMDTSNDAVTSGDVETSAESAATGR